MERVWCSWRPAAGWRHAVNGLLFRRGFKTKKWAIKPGLLYNISGKKKANRGIRPTLAESVAGSLGLSSRGTLGPKFSFKYDVIGMPEELNFDAVVPEPHKSYLYEHQAESNAPLLRDGKYSGEFVNQFIDDHELEAIMKQSSNSLRSIFSPAPQPPSKPSEVLSHDPIAANPRFKFVIVDMTKGKSDHNREILIRESSGDLRSVTRDERDYYNQSYFSKKGMYRNSHVPFEDTEVVGRMLELNQHKELLDLVVKRVPNHLSCYNKCYEQVFRDISKKGIFRVLQNTPTYFEKLVMYLVRSDKIDRLFLELLALDRVGDCCDLVKLYHLTHGIESIKGSETQWFNGNERTNLPTFDEVKSTIKSFVEYKNLEEAKSYTSDLMRHEKAGPYHFLTFGIPGGKLHPGTPVSREGKLLFEVLRSSELDEGSRTKFHLDPLLDCHPNELFAAGVWQAYIRRYSSDEAWLKKLRGDVRQKFDQVMAALDNANDAPEWLRNARAKFE